MAGLSSPLGPLSSQGALPADHRCFLSSAVPVPVHSSWSRFYRPPSLDHFAWPVGFLMVEKARLALILACYPASPLRRGQAVV